jgi:hypothetical protein
MMIKILEVLSDLQESSLKELTDLVTFFSGIQLIY